MKTIRFSIARHDSDSGMSDIYRRLTRGLLTPRNVSLHIEEVTWNNLWAYVQEKSMGASSVDVSEVGTTWLKSLADANALMSISDEFIEKSGAKTQLSDTAWKSINYISPTAVLFWPFMLDVRMIYYWRDNLEAAGIKESNAFSSIKSIRETIEKLRASRLPGWGATSFHGINTLYEISSWVWATGKDYMSPDGKHTAICDSDVQEAISAYFELAQFMEHPYDSYVDLSRAFKQKQVSVMMDGPWLWSDMIHHPSLAVDLDNIGVSKPPGPSFLGGSTLVIWRSAREQIVETAYELLALLTSPDPQRILFERKGLLPVNREVLNRAPFTSDANLRAMAESMSHGRYLPTWPIWGPLESSLVRVFGLIWESLKCNDMKMKPDLLKRHCDPLATRFDKMIAMF